jgi:hypothetical protein
VVVGTTVEAEELSFSSFGSKVWLLTVATFVMNVPGGVVATICPTNENVLVIPTGKLAILQVTVPPDPGLGVPQVQAGPEVC